jgi:hypothetical protein
LPFFVIPAVPLDYRSPAPNERAGVRPRPVTGHLTQGSGQMLLVHRDRLTAICVQEPLESHASLKSGARHRRNNDASGKHRPITFRHRLPESTITHLIKNCLHRGLN